MSLHIPKLRLIELDPYQPDLESSILVIAENDLLVASMLKQCQNILGGANELIGFLRVLDARHLTGYRIYQLLLSQYKGYTSDAFFDFVYYKMPCQICGQVDEFEPLMDAYEKIVLSQQFFAEKFAVKPKFEETTIEKFGLKNDFEPVWQNAVHAHAQTAHFLHNFLPRQLQVVEVAVESENCQTKSAVSKAQRVTIVN